MYKPYYKWECYNSGMYKRVRHHKVEPALEFMLDSDSFHRAMKVVVNSWPVTMSDKLTNHNLNRIAFIGQAACCYAKGLRAVEVKAAWGLMPNHKRILSNNFALNILKTWEQEKKLADISSCGRIGVIGGVYQMKLPLKYIT